MDSLDVDISGVRVGGVCSIAVDLIEYSGPGREIGSVKGNRSERARQSIGRSRGRN
jgi:hypothetical protein